MSKNNVPDCKLNLEAVVKSINKISVELKKMQELSQLLLCDLTMHFNCHMDADDLQETETDELLIEEYEISDVFLDSNSFSN